MSSYKYKVLDLVFTTLFTFVVIFLTMCVIRDDERIFRNMHAHETGGKIGTYAEPTSYFSFDWLVHPVTRHRGSVSTPYKMHMPMQTDACYSSGMPWSNGDCGPTLWQQSDFCPDKNEKLPESVQLGMIARADVSNPATAADIASQLYDKGGDGKSTMQRGDITTSTCAVVLAFWWRNNDMADVCQIERVMEMSLFLNDDTTWSIAASHSTTVLLWGAAVVLWVANVGDLMANNNHFADALSSLRKVKYVLLVAPLAVLCFLRISAKTESSTGVDSARLLPNGSYFYVLLMTMVSSYVIMIIDTTPEDIAPAAVAVDDAEQSGDTDPLFGGDGGGDQRNEEGGPQEFKMNLSGFVKQMPVLRRMDAYMPRTGAKESTLQFSSYSANEVLTFDSFQHHWDTSLDYFSTAQLYSFPLLTLGVYMTGTNYQLDSTLQHLFIAATIYRLIDVATYRLKLMVNIVGRLATKANPVDNCVSRVIELVGLLLQGFVFMFIFMLMHWNLSLGSRLSVPLHGEKSLQAYIETYSSWLYLVYFVLCTVVKATTLVSCSDAIKDGGSATTAAYQSLYTIYQNRRSILFFLLNCFSGILLAMLTVSLMSSKYTSGLPAMMDPVAQNDVLVLYRQYRSGWFRHS